ncbi:MAG: ferrous iron transport protein B [Clostridia bacterium]|nr:ferrous iron transport protein B [Clostridia bacterium]
MNIVLAGNPNVGKSTLFNALTGLKQHTGNWSGKTVDSACGTYFHNNKKFVITDVPGSYSLKAKSHDEAVARMMISSEDVDCVVVVCDANAIERNFNLALQICELTSRVIICVNFADEAERTGTKINIDILERIMNVPVVRINARKKRGFSELFERVANYDKASPIKVSYGYDIENAVRKIEKVLNSIKLNINLRYISLRLLENDNEMWEYVKEHTENNSILYQKLTDVYEEVIKCLRCKGISHDEIRERIALNISATACRICSVAVSFSDRTFSTKEKLADKIFTGKITGFVVMLLLLSVVFYITLSGSNVISEFLSEMLFSSENKIALFMEKVGLPDFCIEMFVHGGYRVLAWVIAVMLPPMAIFFPLFTILEDVGYLPRIAFNLDRAFKKCNACGKQALTTCMGFGCNAVGITGSRIINSPRERLIAILTNSFIPCNGRFPAILCLITVFFASGENRVIASMWLLLVIIIAVFTSMIASYILSHTVLKGIPSSFALELPRFRKPQFGEIVVRSLLSRTLKVLWRAIVVSFPAGVLLWIVLNITIADKTLVAYVVNFFEPIGKMMGLDGTVFTAFLLGIPANEIVLPVAMMLYSSGACLIPDAGIASVSTLLSSNGWNLCTAVCAVMFFIMHWPCATSLLTVKKETGSIKWTFLAFALPTLFGIAVCSVVNLLFCMIL